jgi:hypothetical protein
MHIGRVYGILAAQQIKSKTMEIKAADTFFNSVKRMVNREKWYWKTWDFLRYDTPRFFRNLWMFRKDLYNYRWYSGQHAVLPFMKTALMDMAAKVDERGLEVEHSKSKKVMKMWRAAKLMEHFIEDNFIDLAEAELGDLILRKFEFEPAEQEGYYQLVDNETPEETEHNNKVFNRAREIEEQMWAELWDILKGQTHSHFEVFLDKAKDKEKAYENWFDGSGLRGWWN